jgi:hypothetical protein
MAIKGVKFTEEHKRKISESLRGEKCYLFGKKNIRHSEWMRNNSPRKGIHLSEELKSKIRNSNLGKVVSSDSRKRMSISKIGTKRTDETKKKISLNHRHMQTEETRKKISDILRGKKRKPLTKEHRKNISIGNTGKHSGKNCNFWINGKYSKKYSVDWTKTLKRSIRERDNYTCQLCGEKQEDKVFHIHHIDYDKLNCNPNNLVTLCHSCHSKTNYNRAYWKQVFIN